MTSLFNIFKPRKRSKTIDREVFRQRFENYQEILKANRYALELMAELQQKLSGFYLFDRTYLISIVSQIEGAIRKIIEQLNLLSDQSYPELFEVLEKIMDGIKKELLPPQMIQEYPFTIPFSRIRKDDVPAVGGKCANLGEIKNALGFPVPPGFAISTYAFYTFIEKNHLHEVITDTLNRVDIKTIQDLEAASQQIQNLVLQAQLPEEIRKAIADSYDELIEEVGFRVPVAVRSSGAKEDSPLTSFAGQYKSFLNISGEEVEKYYKLALASQFSPRAIYYFKTRGFDFNEIPLAVGVMAMIPAKGAGVVYTRSPDNPDLDFIIVTAVFGLGTSAVSGETRPDVYQVSRNEVDKLLSADFGKQEILVESLPTGGTQTRIISPEIKNQPVLTKEQISRLATIALTIEKHFGKPQDIEWAIDPEGRIFILQSRPLNLRQQKERKVAFFPKTSKKNLPILSETGTIASQGIGGGPVYLVSSVDDLKNFPPGAVLVSHHAPPDYVLILDRASAIVTEVGSLASHLSTVARELGIPAIFNVPQATEILIPGMEITVDAVNGYIYKGIVKDLIEEYKKPESPFKQTRVYRTLTTIARNITPLYLTDPRGQNFSPRHCKTLHDITRFCHEMAMQEMFSLGEKSSFPEGTTKKLKIPQPLDIYLIDLGEGIEPAKLLSSEVVPEDVKCRPFLALWRGMSKVKWAGPRPVSLRGFMSVIAHSASDPAVMEKLTYKNYVIITDNYMNFSTRLGYHFSSIDAFLGNNTDDNYVQFIFNGGGADITRRIRRARLIEMILKYHGFTTELKEDSLYARGENLEAEAIEKMLNVLGMVVVTTRQMDMVMYNDKLIDYYFNEFIRGNYSFGATIQTE